MCGHIDTVVNNLVIHYKKGATEENRCMSSKVWVIQENTCPSVTPGNRLVSRIGMAQGTKSKTFTFLNKRVFSLALGLCSWPVGLTLLCFRSSGPHTMD